MIDGIVALIVLAAALRGAVRGISDTVLRLAGMIGGGVLAVMFSGRLSAYLMKTKLSSSLHERIYVLLRGEEAAGGELPADGSALVESLDKPSESLADIVSKSISSLFSNAADQAADAASARLAEIATATIAFALILLGVSIAVSLIRHLIKKGRKSSVVLGFTDRSLGLVLGVVRGLLLAWVAVALLIPVTTLVSPLRVPAMMEALQQTTAAKVLYDVNPVLLIVKYVLK